MVNPAQRGKSVGGGARGVRKYSPLSANRKTTTKTFLITTNQLLQRKQGWGGGGVGSLMPFTLGRKYLLWLNWELIRPCFPPVTYQKILAATLPL